MLAFSMWGESWSVYGTRLGELLSRFRAGDTISNFNWLASLSIVVTYINKNYEEL
jgi:hypothetical protein